MSPLAFLFVLVDLWIAVWLLAEVLGLVRRIGGEVVGHHRAGALVLAAAGAIGRITLALSDALGGSIMGVSSDASVWLAADHLSSAALVLAVGMMVRGGFRTADRNRPPRQKPNGYLSKAMGGH